MSLVSYALTTRARLKTFLGISSSDDDSLLDQIINSVSDFVEMYCDRRFKKTDYSDEVYDGNGSKYLILKQYPVVSGETFTLERRDSFDNQDSWSTIDSEYYFVKESAGMVIYVASLNTEGAYFVKSPQHYRVSYTAGYDFDNTGGNTLSDAGIGDLEYAVWKLCAKIYNQRKSSGNIKQEKIGDYSVAYESELMVDQELRNILLSYKRDYGN